MLTQLRSAVASACEGLAGRPWNAFETRPVGDVSIDAVAPDLDSVQWDLAETLEGGTQIGTVEVGATVTLVGSLPKTELAGRGAVTILDLDWSETQTRIAYTRPAQLQWQVIADPGEPPDLDAVSYR